MNISEFANSTQTTSVLELENIQLLLDMLGNPEKKLKFIHIAGTNGKGSVASFLQSIFTYAGYKTGKYTSPELLSVYERISVDGRNIPKEYTEKFFSKVESLYQSSENQKKFPSQFEIWTAMSFCYFLDEKTDIVILETGMGGTGDATNVIPPPECSVITKIAMDHMGYLGNTIEEITSKKCGIIKENSKTVIYAQEEYITNIITENCRSKNNTAYITEKPFIHEFNGIYEIFDYKNIKDIEIKKMKGINQIYNASVAAETALLMGIDEKYIKMGIATAKNPARFEFIKDNIIYDGAHNPNGTEALRDNINRYLKNRKINFVYAMLKDKDIVSSIENMREFSDCSFYITEVIANPRSMKADNLAAILNNNGFKAYPCKDINDALSKACADNFTAVVFGSLYMYKDFITAIWD